MLGPLFFIIVFPALVYYISTILFYRTANSKTPKKTPPTIPYFIPGAFHTFTLAYEGPQKYFGTLLKQYGNFAPFTVKAGLRSFIVAGDATQLNTVLQASRPADAFAAHDEMLETLFSLRIDHNNAKRKEAMQNIYSTLPQKYLVGTQLASSTNRYISVLSANLNNKMFQVDTWTQIEDFLSFFQQVVARCVTETLFGTKIFKQYPGLVKDYQKFADSVDDYMRGMPGYMLSNAYKGPRDKLLAGIEKWLDENYAEGEDVKIDEKEGVWDEARGSTFIQQREGILPRNEGASLRKRAVEMLSIMHGANSTIIPPTFWSIIELIRTPPTHTHLVSQISHFHNPQSESAADYDIPSISNIPLLQSLVAETKRLRTAAVLAHKNTTPGFLLDENWAVPKDTILTFFSQDLSLNEIFWRTVRPNAVEKPLNQFWAERFLVPDSKSGKSTSKKGASKMIQSGAFSLEGLETWSGLFNDNVLGLGLGREFIENMQVATLAVWISQFELQVCDDEAVKEALPQVPGERAYGVVKPLGGITVRIRKRKM